MVNKNEFIDFISYASSSPASRVRIALPPAYLTASWLAVLSIGQRWFPLVYFMGVARNPALRLSPANQQFFFQFTSRAPKSGENLSFQS